MEQTIIKMQQNLLLWQKCQAAIHYRLSLNVKLLIKNVFHYHFLYFFFYCCLYKTHKVLSFQVSITCCLKEIVKEIETITQQNCKQHLMLIQSLFQRTQSESLIVSKRILRNILRNCSNFITHSLVAQVKPTLWKKCMLCGVPSLTIFNTALVQKNFVLKRPNCRVSLSTFSLIFFFFVFIKFHIENNGICNYVLVFYLNSFTFFFFFYCIL